MTLQTALSNISRRFDAKLGEVGELYPDCNSRGALGYEIDGLVLPVAPIRSGYSTVIPLGQHIGRLVEFTGFASSSLVVKKDLGVPAAVITPEGLLLLNAQPFTNWQRWLQLERDVTPYLGWHEPLAWLDEHMSKILSWIKLNAPRHVQERPRTPKRVIILRHDVDNSRDASYLDFERANGLPATWALLLDRNLRYWLGLLGGDSLREIAFHYPSNKDAWTSWLARAWSLLPLVRPLSERHRARSFQRNELSALLGKAHRAGINFTTVHRHWSFVRYPSIIEQLDDCARKGLLSASGSLFEATVIYDDERFRNEGQIGYTHASGFPGSTMWWPFRCHNPSMNESTRFLEFPVLQEPSALMVKNLLQHPIPWISQKLIVVSLHPAHSRTNTFRDQGQLETLRELYEMRTVVDFEFKSVEGFVDEYQLFE